MTRNVLLLVAATAIGLVVAVAMMRVPTGDAPMHGADERPAPIPKAVNTGTPRRPESNGIEAAAATTAAQIDRLISRGFIPSEYRELWLDPDVEQIIKERFDVIPRIELPDGEVCDPIEIDGDQVCWNQYGHHPYLAYDLDDLRRMAESDAVAAEALSLRLPQEKMHERLHYALLASKLSGKSGPIMRFAYSFTPDKDSPDYAEQLLDRYAIALTAEGMGYPYRFSREIENHIRRDLQLSRDELHEAMIGRRVTLLRAMGGGS